MGLKYSHFMINGINADELKIAVLNIGWMGDITELVKLDAEWRDLRYDAMLSGREMSDIPENNELAQYQIMDKKDRYLSIWWMDAPWSNKKSPCVVGGYTRTGFRDFGLYRGALLLNLQISKISNVMLVDYHHGSNSGSCAVYDCDKLVSGDDGCHEYKMTNVEAEDYERYACRIEAETGYPVLKWHKYVKQQTVIPWTCVVGYDIGQVSL